MAVFDNGKAPIVESVKKDEANVPRSAFNMSRVKYMNGLFGALMPFDVLETLPNEDYEIGYDVLATLRNPTVRQMLNGMKIFVHSYWCPKKDLWKGFKNYITGGRSGTVNLEVPYLMPSFKVANLGGDTAPTKLADMSSMVPFAPSSFMGLPIDVCTNLSKEGVSDEQKNKNYWYKGIVRNASTTKTVSKVEANATQKRKFTALPFVMYCKIYRDYYANANLLQNNKMWYHDDEDEDLILPYTLPTETNPRFQGYTNCANGGLLNLADYETKSDRVHVPQKYEHVSNEDKPILNALYFRQFRGDYFTSANPFRDLLRGDSSQLTFDNFKIDWTDVIATSEMSTSHPQNIVVTDYGVSENKIRTADKDYYQMLTSALSNAKVTSGMTLNALRKAVVLEKIMQRAATTNGSYKELIGVQYGYYPKDYSRKPTYIGGAEYTIGFDTVVANNYDVNGNNLGQKASIGGASGSGYIGKFHSDDHGYIMSIMSIVPDVYYAKQGISNMWDRCTRDKEYSPILNNLEPMAILNKEIYCSTSDANDHNVWGYADRYEDWKSRQNEVTGLAMCGEEYDRAQFMLREFGSTPTLAPTTLAMTPNNIDMTPFTSKNEPPFDIAVGCNITKVSPMPYKASPADLGIKY